MSTIDPIDVATLTSREPAVTTEAEALESFDSYMVGEFLRLASQPMLGEEEQIMSGGHAGRMYRDFYFQELGRIAASEGHFGMRAELEGHLGRRGVEEEKP